MFSSYWVLDNGIGRPSDRHTYSFEWNTERATMAEHRVDVVPSGEDLALIDIIDRGIGVSDDDAMFWGVETQLRQMTAGDVALLTRDVERYSSGLQQGNGYLGLASA